MGNKNLRRLSLVVTAQTAWHLEQLARVCGYRETGHVVDKLVREKMLSIRKPFARQLQQAPAVDIATPIPLEALRAAAAERPVLVYVICVDEDGQLLDVESGDWEMFYADTFVADGIRDTTDTYGRVFVAFWDEPGRCDHEA